MLVSIDNWYKACNKLFEISPVAMTLLLLCFFTIDVGFSLRKDNPNGLKDTILEIQSAAQSLGGGDQSSHVKFMLETLMAIKNNNMRKIPNYDPERLEHLKKVARGILRGTIIVVQSIILVLAIIKYKCISLGSTCMSVSVDHQSFSGDKMEWLLVSYTIECKLNF